MGNQWYYIAFLGTKTGALYEYFEKEGFNHVMLFYPVIGNDSYFHTIEHVKTFISAGYVERDKLEAYLENAIVLRVRTKRKTKARWWWWLWTPDTCVTIAKQVLGVHSPFVVTPYQLYKHIKRGMTWEDL